MTKQDDFMEKANAKKIKQLQKAYYKALAPMTKELTATYFAFRQDCARLMAQYDNLLVEIQAIKEKYL